MKVALLSALRLPKVSRMWCMAVWRYRPGAARRAPRHTPASFLRNVCTASTLAAFTTRNPPPATICHPTKHPLSVLPESCQAGCGVHVHSGTLEKQRPVESAVHALKSCAKALAALSDV